MNGFTSAPADLVLAFDYGNRRIGVASGNRVTRTASPVATVQVGAQLPWEELDRILAEWRPRLLLVGIPGNGDATSSIVAAINRFVHALEKRYGLEVVTVDESLSSRAAEAEIREARRAGYLRRRTGRRRLIDRHAACLIAEQWMSEEADVG
jgi:putative pre-16S rRNA nuclease